MTTKVTELGLLVPRDMLSDMDEVEIRRERDSIVIVRAAVKDPILGLGQNPVAGEDTDASINHDAYLQG